MKTEVSGRFLIVPRGSQRSTLKNVVTRYVTRFLGPKKVGNEKIGGILE